MATFRRNRSGNWEVAIRRRNYPSQYGTFDTRAEAERWASVIEGEMARGRFVPSTEAERTSLAQALERYEREVSVRKKGYSQERSRLNRFKRHALSLRSLASIRPKDIAQYISEREGVVGGQTIRLDLELISHLFTVARRRWGMESLSNPVQLT
ncbi:MAG TPA: hypothetical protein VMA09_19640, partial [Candidatus Binataceae bacterium]|nr:hypothetical protein [Candidatus Binataceae bacterium]